MEWENIEDENLQGYHVSLYQRTFPDGRRRYLAETRFDDCDRVIIDHWNLAALRKMIEETLPVMQLARRYFVESRHFRTLS